MTRVTIFLESLSSDTHFSIPPFPYEKSGPHVDQGDEGVTAQGEPLRCSGSQGICFEEDLAVGAALDGGT